MVVPSAVASAQAVNDQGFEIQVSPATVAITLSPGKQKSTSIIVRNLSNHAERLVPKLSGFKIATLLPSPLAASTRLQLWRLLAPA
jgi:hypothetical protein